jgi:hypothetical protein
MIKDFPLPNLVTVNNFLWKAMLDKSMMNHHHVHDKNHHPYDKNHHPYDETSSHI